MKRLAIALIVIFSLSPVPAESQELTYEQINTSGFGYSNTRASGLAVLDGNLYAGTLNQSPGAQVWRYDSGTTWTQVNQDGFGNVPSGYNRSIESMAVMDGKLYAGTWNDDDGAEVWRYDGGTTWTQVNQDGFGGGSSTAIWDLTEYNNSLYAGTMTGGQVWRYDGGTDWTQANVNGFGDAKNSMITSMTALGGKLCAGTDNRTDYCQVWATGNAPTPIPSATPASFILDSGDYDGDSTSDIGIFRESFGLWAIRNLTRIYFGASGDIPASGDYDGDETTDIAVFRGNSDLWAARRVTRLYYGASSDISAPGDYDGDGTCDAAIFRGSTGLWAAQEVTRIYFGTAGDIPVPLYGSGRASAKDIGIFRPDTGLWAIRSITRIYYGGSSDQPLVGNWTTGPGNLNIAIYRESTGLWAIKDVTRIYFGATSDLPISGPTFNPSSAATS